MPSASMDNSRPTFAQVFIRLQASGPARVVSSRGTEYQITADVRGGVETIIGRPRSGQVRIHADCWGHDLTCQRTRAGGIYNGAPSIYDWYRRGRWSIRAGERGRAGSDTEPLRGAKHMDPDARRPRPTAVRPLASRLEAEYRRIAAAHRQAILKVTARSALPPSVTRVFNTGTKDALVDLLGRIPMDELPALADETAFRRWFAHHLDRVAAVILSLNPPETRPRIHPGYEWGHGTKVLALYVRDVVLFSRYFTDADVERITLWLCCPIDGIVIRLLSKLGERPGVALIREIDSARVFWGLQDRMGAAAAAANVPRVWFDDLWGDRETWDRESNR
jgi:hypothetical protein